ncbi:vitamin B12 independent methionine synthase [Lactococcus nasutitermitis]|uniref:Vitamin B12 independent methionine synthase n=1 Tax=Lactococcus nasutitermitis TaxID=1652957 RepID=A0ABV9JBQ3_9LACT|nr:vitamin B12 independent methionine synthase [Lactococcus nasutitermitis]
MTHTHYHFDHVGSYLRPAALKEARAAYNAGTLTSEELRKVQQAAITDLVKKETQAGLPAITDGEFNRSWWHLDFLWGLNGVGTYDQHDSYKFHGEKTRSTNIELVDKIAFNPEHPFFADFEFLKTVLPAGEEAKVTIPSPTMFFRDGRSDRWHEYYENWTDFLDDLAKAYNDTLRHFYDLGARYIQLDDTTWAFLIAKLTLQEEVEKHQKSAEDAVYVINKALENLPEDLRISTHICRGNFKSTYLFEGSYAPIAKYLGQLNYDTFFLEYDDARSGDFEPLKDIWNNRQDVLIVLGIFTSKYPELENKEDILARLNEAAELVPLENLALSTQCGFASTEEGNQLTEEEEWQKLSHIKSIADEIWK